MASVKLEDIKYEKVTDKAEKSGGQPMLRGEIPGALVFSHGPFAWGKDVSDAVRNAVVMEEVAFTDWHAMALSPDLPPMQRELLDRHYLRKHGKNAYYGQ